MAQAGLEKRPFMVRFAESRAGKEEILASLSAQGVDYPESLDAFREGLIRIQDLSSSLAGDAAGIKEGDFVLDVCGAPGGKGLHAADLLHGTGQVEIRDVSDYKVSLIKENIARSGCTNVSACAFDACEFDASMEQKADVVIAEFRTWHYRTQAGYQIQRFNGRNPGPGCIAAADAVGGLAVREAGGSAGLQHLHGQPSGK